MGHKKFVKEIKDKVKEAGETFGEISEKATKMRRAYPATTRNGHPTKKGNYAEIPGANAPYPVKGKHAEVPGANAPYTKKRHNAGMEPGEK